MDIQSFQCKRCQEQYYEKWHFSSDYKTALPDIDICQKCRQHDLDLKVAEVKHKILKSSTDPMVWLQAEVEVLREHLIASGMSPQHYWEKVHTAVKTRADRKRDKTNG